MGTLKNASVDYVLKNELEITVRDPQNVTDEPKLNSRIPSLRIGIIVGIPNECQFRSKKGYSIHFSH